MTTSPLPDNPTPPPMPIQPLGVSGVSTNPVLEEISAAHANLSPQAQQAIEGAHGILGISPAHSDPALAASAAPSVPEVAVPGVSGPRGPLPILAPETPARNDSMVPGIIGVRASDIPARSDEDLPLSSPSPLRNPSAEVLSPRASASPTMPISPHQAEFERLTKPALPSSDPNAHTALDTGRPGAEQIHNPWLRGLATVGDVLASGLFPRFGQFIPGTSGYHNRLVANEKGALGEEQAGAKSAADIAREQAEAEHATAEAENQKQAGTFQTAGGGIYNLKTHEWEVEPPAKDKDQLLEIDPDKAKALGVRANADGKYYIPPQAAGELLKPVAAKELKEGELPLGDRVHDINEALTARYQVLHPGTELPRHYLLPPNATQKDFDRTDKLIEGEEKAFGTDQTRKQTDELRKQTAALANQGASERATGQLDREVAQYGKYHEGIHAGATQQLDKILDAQTMIAKDSPESLALAVPKILTALVSGQGTGVRITQAELNQIARARGIGGDIQAFVQKLTSGKSLTTDQRKQLSDVMDSIADRVREKGRISGMTEDAIKGASSRADILKADKDGREWLDNYENGKIKVQIPGHEPGFIPATARDRFLKDNPTGKIF